MTMRFGYNDEDEDFQDDMFPDSGDEDYEDYDDLTERTIALDERQLDLVQLDLNQQLLFEAVDIASKSWKWRFYKEKTKLQLIADNYLYLYELVRKTEKNA